MRRCGPARPLRRLRLGRQHAARLVTLRAAARGIGCALEEPFLQLAFLPLPVIPHLKLTDRGYVAAGPEGLRLLD